MASTRPRGRRQTARSKGKRSETPELPNTVEDLDKAILEVLQSIEDDFVRANSAVSCMIRDARPFVRSTGVAIEALEPLAAYLQTFASEPQREYLQDKLNQRDSDSTSMGDGPIADETSMGQSGAGLSESVLGASGKLVAPGGEAASPSESSSAAAGKGSNSQPRMEASASSDPATPLAQLGRPEGAPRTPSGTARSGDSELEDALLREPAAPAFRTVVPHTPAVLRAREHLATSAIGTPLHGSRRRRPGVKSGAAGGGATTPGGLDPEADGPLGLFSPPVTTPFLRASMKPPRSSIRRRTGTGKKSRKSRGAASSRKAEPLAGVGMAGGEAGDEEDEGGIDEEESDDEGALLGFVDDEDDLGLRASILAGPLDYAELDGVGGGGKEEEQGDRMAASGTGTGGAMRGTEYDEEEDGLASPELPKFSKRATMMIRKSMAPASMGGALLPADDDEDDTGDGMAKAGQPSMAEAGLPNDDADSDSDAEEQPEQRSQHDFSLDLFPTAFRSGPGAIQLAAVWSHFAGTGEVAGDGERSSASVNQVANAVDGVSEAVARLLLGLLVDRGFVRAANVGGEVFYRLR